MQDEFLFTYWNGAETVHGDPADLHYRLLELAQGQLGQWWEDSRRRGPEDSPGDTPEALAEKEQIRSAEFLRAIPAIRRLEKLARGAFEMAEYDRKTGKGATASDCARVLGEFFAFITVEKKNPDDVLTGSPPTDSEAAS